jgi:hypothetical protein
MVFMAQRNDGHPLAATLLLFSIFAFAFVFHAVTRQQAVVPAQFDVQLAAFASGIDADRPQLIDQVPARSGRNATVVTPVFAMDMPVSVLAPIETIDQAPVVESAAWPAIAAALAAPVQSRMPPQRPMDEGAVTRAFGTTSSALRNAFKKTF